jgi:hypothetical protein
MRAERTRARGGALALLLALTALAAWAPTAWAASTSVPDNPSFDQYVPSLPASSGKKAPGITSPTPTQTQSGAPGAGRTAPAAAPKLSNRVRRRLRREGDAGKRLDRLSTSADLGAPVDRLNIAAARSPGAGSAAVHAVGRAGGAAGLALLGLLVLITAGLVIASPAWRRRGDGDS